MGTIGSGNVFADLGLPDDETRLLKAKLVSKVDDVIVERGLSDGAAGAIMGLSRQKVSELRNGRTDDYSVERLYEFLNSQVPVAPNETICGVAEFAGPSVLKEGPSRRSFSSSLLQIPIPALSSVNAFTSPK